MPTNIILCALKCRQVYLQCVLPAFTATAAALHRLSGVRQQLGQLHGCPSFAHMMQQNSLSAGPEAAIDFLQQLAAAVKPLAEAQLAAALSAQRDSSAEGSTPWPPSNPAEHVSEVEPFDSPVSDPQTATQSSSGAAVAAAVSPWDVDYLLTPQNSADQSTVDLTVFETRLHLANVLENFNGILSRLLAVQIQPSKRAVADAAPGPSSDQVLEYVAIDTVTRSQLGLLYIELDAGYGTRLLRYGNCQQSAVSSRGPDSAVTEQEVAAQNDGQDEHDLPAVSIGLQFATTSLTAVGSLREVLHELGHALHLLLSSGQAHMHFGGLFWPKDIIEFPSMLFERFCLHPSTVALLLRDPATGEPLDLKAATRVSAAYRKAHYSAYGYHEKVLTALSDQLLAASAPSADPGHWWRAVWAQFGTGMATSTPCPNFDIPSASVEDSAEEVDGRGSCRLRVELLSGLPASAKQLSLLPVVAHQRGMYYIYMYSWCISSALWESVVDPVLGELHAGPKPAAVAPASHAPLRDLFQSGCSTDPATLISRLAGDNVWQRYDDGSVAPRINQQHLVEWLQL